MYVCKFYSKEMTVLQTVENAYKTMMTTTATTASGQLDATTPSFIPQIITADVHRSGE